MDVDQELDQVRLQQPPARSWAEIDAWDAQGVWLSGIATRGGMFPASRREKQKAIYFRVKLTGRIYRVVSTAQTVELPAGAVKFWTGITTAAR